MPRIFINYRRDDSAGYAGRIHETLASLFGTESVFIDVDDIKPGVDYVSTIEDSIAGCDVMLVLIGKRWLDSRDSAGGRRIDDPADFVRIEIERGLARNIRTIPVVIDNASMPAHADLPSDISRLATLEAIALSDSRWQYDIGQLVSVINGGIDPPRPRRRRLIRLVIGGAALLAAAALGGVWLAQPSPDVSGRWVADVRYDSGGDHSEVFVLRFNEGRLSGTASYLGVARSLVQGEVNGSRVSFSTRSEEVAGSDSRQAEHKYSGAFKDDELRLSLQTDGGFSSHVPVDIVAKRTAR
ncbi:MAG: toll/interleukin-1 receptor domain-containing protein [Vicinamibacterales bacterium]